MAEFFIPVANYSKFEEICTKVSKRLIRHGLEPVDTPLPAYEDLKEFNGRQVAVYSVLFHDEVISLGPWKMVAALDHATETGAVIRTFAGQEVPTKYRTSGRVCDHCGVKRDRNTTYVVCHGETGEYKQVGSTCLDLFTGVDTSKLVRRAELLDYLRSALGGLCEDHGGASYAVELEHYAPWVARVIREWGFITRKMVQQSDEELVPTSVSAYIEMYSPKSMSAPSEEDIAVAEAALEAARAIEEPKNDYEHNVKIVANCALTKEKHLGIAAAIVGCYMRDQERKRSEASSATLNDFAGVIELLKRPQAKFPKITLQTEDGKAVVLSVAGERSKNAGMVNVTNGRPYGDYNNEWYGKVSPDGLWMPSGRVDAKTIASITTLLTRLAMEPAKVAAEYGRLTGDCSFCKRPLKDARSMAVGYGKTCAAQYGLPWGTVCN